MFEDDSEESGLLFASKPQGVLYGVQDLGCIEEIYGGNWNNGLANTVKLRGFPDLLQRQT